MNNFPNLVLDATLTLIQPSPAAATMKPNTNQAAVNAMLSFLTWLIALLAAGAFAQGTVVFSNGSSYLSSPPDRLVRFDPVTVGTDPQYNPFGTNNAPVLNFGSSSYRAQLYYGSSTATEDSLVPVTAAPAIFRSWTTTIEPGTWAGGVRTLVGFNPGDTLNLQVRVWDSAYASSWEEYLLVQQGLAGESRVFSYWIQPDPIGPRGHAMDNFEGFVIGIPEPSALSLGVLSVAALCFRLSKGRHWCKQSSQTGEQAWFDRISLVWIRLF